MKHQLFPGVTMVMLLTACAFAQTRDPGELQKSRSQWVSQKANQRFDKKELSLEALPHYRPEQKASGVIHEWGSNYFMDSRLGRAWETEFRKYQPGVIFEYNLKSRELGIPGLFHGGSTWNEALKEYANRDARDGHLVVAGEDMLADLSKDPYGIAYSGIPYQTPQTKVLALAQSASGPYVPLTLDTVHDHTYPLTRDVYLYLNREPDKPIEPKIKEFIRYVSATRTASADERWQVFAVDATGTARAAKKSNN
jgi:hypothetical protein